MLGLERFYFFIDGRAIKERRNPILIVDMASKRVTRCHGATLDRVTLYQGTMQWKLGTWHVWGAAEAVLSVQKKSSLRTSKGSYTAKGPSSEAFAAPIFKNVDQDFGTFSKQLNPAPGTHLYLHTGRWQNFDYARGDRDLGLWVARQFPPGAGGPGIQTTKKVTFLGKVNLVTNLMAPIVPSGAHVVLQTGEPLYYYGYKNDEMNDRAAAGWDGSWPDEFFLASTSTAPRTSVASPMMSPQATQQMFAPQPMQSPMIPPMRAPVALSVRRVANPEKPPEPEGETPPRPPSLEQSIDESDDFLRNMEGWVEDQQKKLAGEGERLIQQGQQRMQEFNQRLEAQRQKVLQDHEELKSQAERLIQLDARSKTLGEQLSWLEDEMKDVEDDGEFSQWKQQRSGSLPVPFAQAPASLEDMFSERGGIAESALKPGKMFSPGGTAFPTVPPNYSIEQDLQSQAMRTSAPANFARKALVPRVVASMVPPGSSMEILDFGAGKDLAHTRALSAPPYNLNVTAHDFSRPNPDALSRKYDLVFASNVLNVQGSPQMAAYTMSQVYNLLKPGGFFVANYPDNPRYSPYTATQFLNAVATFFGSPVQVVSGKLGYLQGGPPRKPGKASAPVFIVQKSPRRTPNPGDSLEGSPEAFMTVLMGNSEGREENPEYRFKGTDAEFLEILDRADPMIVRSRALSRPGSSRPNRYQEEVEFLEGKGLGKLYPRSLSVAQRPLYIEEDFIRIGEHNKRFNEPTFYLPRTEMPASRYNQQVQGYMQSIVQNYQPQPNLGRLPRLGDTERGLSRPLYEGHWSSYALDPPVGKVVPAHGSIKTLPDEKQVQSAREGQLMEEAWLVTSLADFERQVSSMGTKRFSDRYSKMLVDAGVPFEEGLGLDPFAPEGMPVDEGTEYEIEMAKRILASPAARDLLDTYDVPEFGLAVALERSEYEPALFKAIREKSERVGNPEEGRGSNPTLHFNTKKMNDKQKESLREAEIKLREAGIYFDTAYGLKDGSRDWQLDFSIKGPLEVSIMEGEWDDEGADAVTLEKPRMDNPGPAPESRQKGWMAGMEKPRSRFPFMTRVDLRQRLGPHDARQRQNLAMESSRVMTGIPLPELLAVLSNPGKYNRKDLMAVYRYALGGCKGTPNEIRKGNYSRKRIYKLFDQVFSLPPGPGVAAIFAGEEEGKRNWQEAARVWQQTRGNAQPSSPMM